MKFRELLEGKTPEIGDVVRAHNDSWKVLRDITAKGYRKQFECESTTTGEISDIYVISMK